MSGNGYKVLGFLVWKGATWYLRQRSRQRARHHSRTVRRVGAGMLAAGAVVAAGGVVLAQRRSGHTG